jgi:hypothetical protein
MRSELAFLEDLMMTWPRKHGLGWGMGLEAPQTSPIPHGFWDKHHLSTINIMKYPIDGGRFYKL